MNNQLKTHYVGNTLLLNWTHKINGIPTAITADMTISSAASTSNGIHALSVVINSDQVANAGKFTTGAIMDGWGVGIVKIDIKTVINGATPIGAINQLIENTPTIQFLLEKGIS